MHGIAAGHGGCLVMLMILWMKRVGYLGVVVVRSQRRWLFRGEEMR